MKINSKLVQQRRSLITGIITLTLIGGAGVLFFPKWRNYRAPETGAKFNLQQEKAQVFLPPASDPLTPPNVFTINCADCHGSHGQGGEIGPRLVGVSAKPRRTPADLEKLLNGPRAFGLRSPMPDSFTHLSPEEKRQIVEWLSKL